MSEGRLSPRYSALASELTSVAQEILRVDAMNMLREVCDRIFPTDERRIKYILFRYSSVYDDEGNYNPVFENLTMRDSSNREVTTVKADALRRLYEGGYAPQLFKEDLVENIYETEIVEVDISNCMSVTTDWGTDYMIDMLVVTFLDKGYCIDNLIENASLLQGGPSSLRFQRIVLPEEITLIPNFPDLIRACSNLKDGLRDFRSYFYEETLKDVLGQS